MTIDRPTLTQVQIIQSLAEALSWFEKELSWGVSPGELNHLTGRIGELYAAEISEPLAKMQVARMDETEHDHSGLGGGQQGWAGSCYSLIQPRRRAGSHLRQACHIRPLGY